MSKPQSKDDQQTKYKTHRFVGLRSALGLLPARHTKLPVLPSVPENNATLGYVDGKIDFYDYTAKLAMNRYHFMRFLQFVFGALVPISQVAETGVTARILAAVFGGAVVVIQAMESYLHDAEHYPSYRAAAEQMMRERAFFGAGAGQYAQPPTGKTALVLLLENVEGTATQEQAQWQLTQQKTEGGTPSGS